MVRVRLLRRHGIIVDGRRVKMPAGSVVEVSEHVFRAFADRMLVEEPTVPDTVDARADHQETAVVEPESVPSENDGATEIQQDQQETTETPVGQTGELAYELLQRPGGWYGIVVNGQEVAKCRKGELKEKLGELGLAE